MKSWKTERTILRKARVYIMRIFISHASKNKEIVLKFAEFLESVSSEIEVFCSSENGRIKVGKNFIQTIFEKLGASDLFVPILSKEYYESRFCMIELGVAYSYLFNKYENNGEEYIIPFALYPVRKGQALSGTPMVNIQVGEVNDEEDIRSFLEYISSEKGIHIGSGTNRKIHSFKTELDQIFLTHQNIVELAKIGTYFDDSIDYKRKQDIANYSVKDNTITVNFNMNPYDLEEIRYPNFISMVLKYVDKIDIGLYLNFNDSAEFRCMVTNFTNYLKRIFIEFKYSDNNRVLETFEFPIVYGENNLSIPLREMRSKVLSEISEICFVIHPDDIIEKEGMFQIRDIKVC